jgi:hypothetical protein
MHWACVSKQVPFERATKAQPSLRAQRSNPEIAPPSHYLLEEIMPVWIEGFDQGEFCRSRAALDLRLA